MDSEELLTIDPSELRFPFELKKPIPSSFQLLNKTDKYVAFKVKTTNPKKYSVRPNNGVVLPRSTCSVIVTMQAQKEAPSDLQCKDRFLIQSVVTRPGVTPKDITPEMFNKETSIYVEERKLKVVYVAPPKPPSPVPEESEEGSSPRASDSENGHFSTSEVISSERSLAKDNSVQVTTDLSKLIEEKNRALQKNDLLYHEMARLKREYKSSTGGVRLLYVVLIGLLGILFGYYMTGS